ncbi:MAG: T9SS type A sorting domain-containing protein [candidate division KSB1 bacterium]|nr:T9SS type A sorting domain-containing protein [candidate division KSB1 bacterium]MDZ7302539.1 T9SS type A sorting domain-containing protein [candidate division KSB1 bacterium]MDZ7310695.1 T9SS type A sorting domain-containing protein [candidate division KSB1 bacterium]
MKRFVIFLIGAMFLSVSLFAQKKDTTYVNGMYSGGSEGELNAAVQAAINAGTLSKTVFKLKHYDWYVVNGTIEVPKGQTLEIVAPPAGNTQESAPPQILWTASGSVTKTFLIAVYGDLIMRNIWVRFADAAGIQTGTPIVFEGDTAGVGGVAQYGTFENCVFEWMPCPVVTASGSICVRSKHFNGVFKNCFFRNCTDRHFMYYGRAVSFPYDVPGYHTDYISFENCTFTNLGYVYMQERTNYADNVHFNHCTFYNVVMFSLENGWWWKLNVNNCLFVNAYMLGYIPAQGVSGATVTIAPVGSENFSFAVPFTDQDRHILFTHNAYYLDDWLVDWMRGGWEKNYGGTPWRPDPRITSVGNPYSLEKYRARLFNEIPYPRPMLDSTALVFFDSTSADGKKLYPYINRAALYDVTELREKVNPRFITAPLNLEPLKYFLWQKWSTNKDSMWAYMPEAGFNQQWPLPENLAYANDTLKTAGMGGFPLGDLYHWWNPAVRKGAKDYYSAWLAQSEAEKKRIATWLETGQDPLTGVVRQSGTAAPTKYTLEQNYPNPFGRLPFNPTTQIRYSVPRNGHVSLNVYNNLGQKVATLFDGVQQAGNYVATFDATGLADGVYFYRLQSGTVTITKKLVLVK